MMKSNTGKSGTCVTPSVVYVAELSLSRGSKVSARLNGWFPKTAQHGQYLPSLFAIHELFKIQFLHVRRLHGSMRDYL